VGNRDECTYGKQRKICIREEEREETHVILTERNFIHREIREEVYQEGK
jgi:hypothetical protein